ncbi:MAG: hypothetical protein ACKVS9_04045 [Phycisphaerae bacterium]
MPTLTLAPASSDADLRAIVAGSLPRIWRYLKTWQVADGRFAGLIATWWSSYIETAVPHPMNQFPIILGLLELHEAGVAGGEWLAEARRVGDGLAASIGPDNRMENDWGDIPGNTTGPIFYTSCIRAMADLYVATREPRYLDAAMKLDALNNRWVRGDMLVGCLVSNQVLGWAWSRMCLARATGNDALTQQARRIARADLEHQIRGGPLDGGYRQGRFDDRLMTIYCGKCIQPLVEVSRATGDRDLLEAASRAGRYLTRQEIDPGIWINVRSPGGWWMKLMRPVTSLDRRVLRLTVPVYRLRRLKQDWQAVDYPSWYARAADPIRALWELHLSGGIEREYPERYARKLLALQYPHGGFPNTAGFSGDAKRVMWQDAAPCTRWNAYVFYLLCRLARLLGVKSLDALGGVPSEWSHTLSDGCTLHETDETIEQRRGSDICWRIIKRTGASQQVSPEFRGELTGVRCGPW